VNYHVPTAQSVAGAPLGKEGIDVPTHHKVDMRSLGENAIINHEKELGLEQIDVFDGDSGE